MDRLVEPDQALAAADGVRMTPSMVVIANGIRHMVAPVLPLPQLEAYIDALMGKTDQ
jgi:protein-disulfide isomerase